MKHAYNNIRIDNLSFVSVDAAKNSQNSTFLNIEKTSLRKKKTKTPLSSYFKTHYKQFENRITLSNYDKHYHLSKQQI